MSLFRKKADACDFLNLEYLTVLMILHLRLCVVLFHCLAFFIFIFLRVLYVLLFFILQLSGAFFQLKLTLLYLSKEVC